MEEIMKNVVEWVDRPFWVRLGLFGIRRRKVATGWMYGSLVSSVVLAVAWIAWGFPVFSFAGALVAFGLSSFVSGTLWYLLAIQWTDEHEGWLDHAQSPTQLSTV
jgi:hypothetical protein